LKFVYCNLFGSWNLELVIWDLFLICDLKFVICLEFRISDLEFNSVIYNLESII